jgi:hypothetical protein
MSGISGAAQRPQRTCQQVSARVRECRWMRNASTKPLHRAAEHITSTRPRITSTHACGVPLLSQARDLGSVRCLPSDGVLELSAFKFRVAIPERVQATRTSRSDWETKGQVRGSDEFRHPQRGQRRTSAHTNRVCKPHSRCSNASGYPTAPSRLSLVTMRGPKARSAAGQTMGRRNQPAAAEAVTDQPPGQASSRTCHPRPETDLSRRS